MLVNNLCSHTYNLKVNTLKGLRFFRQSALFLFIIAFAHVGCIEEFYPNLNTAVELLVIDGTILKGDSLQFIYVSKSTPVNNPENNPVSGCNVSVADKMGNIFQFKENNSGTYICEIPQQFLSYNSSFQLHVITPNNNEYRSDYETILESSPVDSLYTEIKYYQSSSEEYNKGVQFYTDLKAPEGATKNYLWRLEETWEIQTLYHIDGRYKRGSMVFPTYFPLSDSISICWSTEAINNIYTSSTRNLSINEKKKIPLNFIPSTSAKNNYKYCLLVKQYSLSDAAYQYWEQNKVAAMESGGLYQTQPSQSRSNIYNVDNADEVVLGFFWASSFSSKRKFIDNKLTPFNIDCSIFECLLADECNLLARLESLNKEIVYLVALTFAEDDPYTVIEWGFPQNQICIDCTTEGGSILKPDYWP